MVQPVELHPKRPCGGVEASKRGVSEAVSYLVVLLIADFRLFPMSHQGFNPIRKQGSRNRPMSPLRRGWNGLKTGHMDGLRRPPGRPRTCLG